MSHPIYHPIDPSSQRIRLLEIYDDSESTLWFGFREVELSTRPSYKALSYHWGDLSSTPLEIWVGGKRFMVLYNLYAFLSEYKPPRGTTEFFWIDQICIDQNNVDEKNHQVKLMGEIYSHAAEVVVWLGQEADDSSWAMKFIGAHKKWDHKPSSLNSGSFIEKIQQHSVESLEFPKSLTFPEDSYFSAVDPLEVEEWDNPLKLEESDNSEHYKSILALFARPYWSRVWVIQEIILAPQVVVFCGGWRAPWSNFEEFFLIPKTFGSEPALHPNELFKVDAPMAEKIVRMKASAEEDTQRLSDVLGTFLNWNCQDPKDKIYGLLGLVPQSARVDIDYRKSLSEISRDVIRKVVRDEFYLNISSHLDFAKALQRGLGITDVNLEDVVRYESRAGRVALDRFATSNRLEEEYKHIYILRE